MDVRNHLNVGIGMNRNKNWKLVDVWLEVGTSSWQSGVEKWKREHMNLRLGTQRMDLETML